MLKRIKRRVNLNWPTMLVLLAAIGLLINLALFYPGYMSADTLRNLNQAKGAAPISDLQPPLLPVLWKILIFVTGKIASMLVLQLLVFWSALSLLSIYLWRTTRRKGISLLPYILAFSPIVINISGVIWSDNQMAFSLLLSVVLILWAQYIVNKPLRNILLIAAFFLILYANLVRSNSPIAALPLIFLLVNKSGFIARRSKQVYLTIAIGVLFIMMVPITKALFVQQHITSTAGPMMDDIVHVASYDDIQDSFVAQPLKESLIKIKKCTIEKQIVIDSFPCGSELDKTNILIKYPNDIPGLWQSTLKNHPMHYLMRKIIVFVYVLFPPQDRGYIWQAGIEPNQFGLQTKFSGLGEINRMVVFNFGWKHFSYLYEPWFWLMANIILLYYAQKLKLVKIFVVSLSVSGILYILGFFPTGVAADYRYIYWPVIAALTSSLLLLSEKYRLPTPSQKTKN